MKFITQSFVMMAMLGSSCQSVKHTAPSRVQIITLDPGHFHAALVQKSMYPGVDSTVHVYASAGPDVEQHLARINAYNSGPQGTHWNEVVYKGNDFLEKMIADKKGNVVVISGNNHRKTEYIKRSIDRGFHVLADKPMVIDPASFEVLKKTFEEASQKNLLLYDIMTERYEITNMLQKEFSTIPEVFGTLQKGSPENPAVEMESVHFFYKYVSGRVLTRPAWFMDISQQGEAIADVATHLVDLVQWECFPAKSIDYKKDIQIDSARRWSTDLTLSQFTAVTKEKVFPDYLKKEVARDSVLPVFANGQINYQLNGVHVKVIARWDYQAPEGSGDTHYSKLRGTKANLVIRQGAEQKFKPTLFIEPVESQDALYEQQLIQKLKDVQANYPGVELKKINTGWEVIIPEKYKDGHEAHFAKVTEKFLGFLKNGDMPAWEVPNMLAKYYTTTQAVEWARKNQKTNTF